MFGHLNFNVVACNPPALINRLPDKFPQRTDDQRPADEQLGKRGEYHSLARTSEQRTQG